MLGSGKGYHVVVLKGIRDLPLQPSKKNPRVRRHQRVNELTAQQDKMVARGLIQKLAHEGVLKEGRLASRPDWLHPRDVQRMEAAGLLRKEGASGTYVLTAAGRKAASRDRGAAGPSAKEPLAVMQDSAGKWRVKHGVWTVSSHDTEEQAKRWVRQNVEDYRNNEVPLSHRQFATRQMLTDMARAAVEDYVHNRDKHHARRVYLWYRESGYLRPGELKLAPERPGKEWLPAAHEPVPSRLELRGYGPWIQSKIRLLPILPTAQVPTTPKKWW